jgi:hypothetical protein
LVLADVQRGIREALTSGHGSGLESMLIGGPEPSRRLGIHQRHYRVSLASSLVTRFPATAWLVGVDFITAAAREFVAAHPPTQPCIAEYGEAFPGFLASRPAASPVPYLAQFASLEWHVARVSLAIDRAPLTAEQFQALGPDTIAAGSVSLQPGVHWAQVDWSIDELFSAYLADTAPEQFELVQGPFDLEVRGARGAFTISRLDPGVLTFRSALASGRSVVEAITHASAVEPAFDVTRAVVELIASGLVATVHSPTAAAGGTP